MRIVSLFLFLAVLAVPSMGQAFQFVYEPASLNVQLPAGFELVQSSVDNLPEHGFFYFTDVDAARTLAIEIHSGVSERQREYWLSGRAGQDRLANFQGVRAIDPNIFPLPVGAAFTYATPCPGGRGHALFGCDDSRCYRIDVTGTAEYLSGPHVTAGLVSGVRFGR